MMKILITGTAGFIGYSLVSELLVKNGIEDLEIVGLDNICDYYDTNLKYSRLNEHGILFENRKPDSTLLLQSSRFKNYRFIKMDLKDKLDIDNLFKDEKFDMVINLAAQAGVRYSIDNPYAYVDSNLIGFINILEAMRNTNVKKLIFASSSSVYGNSTKTPFSTDDMVDKPISLYAATKKSNELMAYTYSHLYGINTIGLRFFTVYGPFGRPDMAYFKFVDKIVNGETIDVYNNGNLERDYTFIDDIVTGISRIVSKFHNPSIENEAVSKIYNIGNGSPVNLLDFIKEIEKNLGIVAEKNFLPMQAGDVYQTFADTTNLQKDFDYKPSIKFSDGIKKFIDWYRGYYKK